MINCLFNKKRIGSQMLLQYVIAKQNIFRNINFFLVSVKYSTEMINTLQLKHVENNKLKKNLKITNEGLSVLKTVFRYNNQLIYKNKYKLQQTI